MHIIKLTNKRRMTLIITLCLDIPYMVLGVLCIDYILTAVRVPVNLLACLNPQSNTPTELMT